MRREEIIVRGKKPRGQKTTVRKVILEMFDNDPTLALTVDDVKNYERTKGNPVPVTSTICIAFTKLGTEKGYDRYIYKQRIYLVKN